MAKRLTKLQVDEVSVVDKGANNKRFLILKQAEEDVQKHGSHDQSSHGNWARGGGAPPPEIEDRPFSAISRRKEGIIFLGAGGDLKEWVQRSHERAGEPGHRIRHELVRRRLHGDHVRWPHGPGLHLQPQAQDQHRQAGHVAASVGRRLLGERLPGELRRPARGGAALRRRRPRGLEEHQEDGPAVSLRAGKTSKGRYPRPD